MMLTTKIQSIILVTKLKKWVNISKKNTIYLISSYEFSYDIEYELLKNKISNYYKIYTGYSRDLMTCFKLNKKRI